MHWIFRSLLLILSFSTQYSFAQMSIKQIEQFKSNQSFRKIQVSIEDHTVWAINTEGKVYYKPENATDFIIYPHTSTLSIKDLAGFNKNEMYFLQTSSQLVYIKNGVSNIINVSNRINNIAVLYRKYVQLQVPIQSDLLAIATIKDMYVLPRGMTGGMAKVPYVNNPIDPQPDWNILHSGHRTVDFRYKYPSGGRCFDADRVNMTAAKQTLFQVVIPDKAPYPSKINATLTSMQPMFTYINSDSKFILSFWGTDKGLFVRNLSECFDANVKNILPEKEINYIENMYGLTPVYKQEFVFAATNSGLYYTPASVFGELSPGYPDLKSINFIGVPELAEKKIYYLSTDTYDENINNSFLNFNPIVCEKTIWAATETGIFKLTTSLDNEHYKPETDITTTSTPGNSNKVIPILEIIPGQNLNFNIRIKRNFGNELRIQWFRNGNEVTEWDGLLSIVMTEAAEYYAKVTVVCENITLTTQTFIAKKVSAPEITFDYPPELIVCENQPYELSTINNQGYTYRWYKDNDQISNTDSKILVSIPGIYHVEVSNIFGLTSKSSSVKITHDVVTKPEITSIRNAYCLGETANLAVNNSENLNTKWFKNGTEIVSLANQNSILTKESGNYTVRFENSQGCTKTSSSFSLTFTPLANFSIFSSKSATICFGESTSLSASISGKSYKWSTGETSPTISVSSSGTYSLDIENISGCIQTASIDIIVLDELDIVQNNERTICHIAGEHVLLQAKTGFKNYYWNGIKGLASFEVTKPGNYILEVEDNLGCRATRTYKVVEFCSEVIVPNTFTPNGDGINDYWNIGGLENDRTAHVTIFNRYGNIIYQSRGSSPTWDGTFNGQVLTNGTYFYTIKTNQSAKILKGSVLILR